MYFVIAGSVVCLIIFFYFRTLFIQLTVIIVLLISVDLITSLFIKRIGHKEFRIQQPEPYINAEYFSKDFINESFAQPGGWLLDKTYGGVKPSNFEGKWINVRNNKRVTINKPGNYLRKIYLFGGSTVIILTEKGKIQFDEDLLQATKNRYESYIKLGDRIGLSKD